MCLLGCKQTVGNGQQKLRIATTTSTRDSGLLDILLPEFRTSYPCDISVLAVGTGAALKLGQQGEVDLLLVHAPAAEAEFMEGKHGEGHDGKPVSSAKDKKIFAAFHRAINKYSSQIH